MLPSCSMNIWEELTKEFNDGRIRAVLSSGQAVVYYGLALMSKDGDWILREDEESINHILNTLQKHGAVYRFGAPLDIRWLKFGWSSHFEFSWKGKRIRCDFVSRPPRISNELLASIWARVEASDVEKIVSKSELVQLKLTNREKDYVVIGELVRTMTSDQDILRYSRDPEQILSILRSDPQAIDFLKGYRPTLAQVVGCDDQIERLEEELDRERRLLIRANSKRISAYMDASVAYQEEWKKIAPDIEQISLSEQHSLLVQLASRSLPHEVTF